MIRNAGCLSGVRLMLKWRHGCRGLLCHDLSYNALGPSGDSQLQLRQHAVFRPRMVNDPAPSGRALTKLNIIGVFHVHRRTDTANIRGHVQTGLQ